MTDDEPEPYDIVEEGRRQLGDMLAGVFDRMGDKAIVTRALIIYEVDQDPTDEDAPVTLDYRSTGGLTDVDFIGLLELTLALLRQRALDNYEEN